MLAGSAKWAVLSAAHGYCLTVKIPIQRIQRARANQVWGSFFRLWVGDVAGRCLQLSRAVASMGVDWYWIFVILENILSSMVTGN